MNLRVAIVLLGVVFAVPLAAADEELSVDYDVQTNFGAFKTFSIDSGELDSKRPELDNPLYAQLLTDAIRAALVTRGLSEQSSAADLQVSFLIKGDDYNSSVRPPLPGAGRIPKPHAEGTLIIDLVKPAGHVRVWRGVYRDIEPVGSKLLEKLTQGAAKLIHKYPPSHR